MDEEFNIEFIDIKEREIAAKQALKNDIGKLEARRKKNGTLSAVDAKELARLEGIDKALTEQGVYVDPLFASARAVFGQANGVLQPINIDHDDGVLSISDATNTSSADRYHDLIRVALALGMLQSTGIPLPAIKKIGKGVGPDPDHENYASFVESLFGILGRISGNLRLARAVLPILVQQGNVVGDDRKPLVSTLEFARVVNRLVERGVKATDPHLRSYVEEGIDRVQDVGENRPMHEIGINLPDLEAITDYVVVDDNIRLMGPMIFASMFEELKAFQVVDRLIEMSQRGELPLIRGKAGTKLYQYWREAPNRMSEGERQTFYAMTLGVPSGQPDAVVNTDFQDLWTRFVSSVSSLVRENRVDQLLRSSLPVAINQQQVKKAARDLANNMSLHGYGMAYYAAIDLQGQINEMIDLLSERDIMGAFGARDMFGVIDQIAQVELGGARNSSKYRTLATCGAIITNWLANHTDRLRDPTAPIIELREVENPPPRASGESATSHPTDYDLVNACELWLADSALGEDQVEHFSQPRESPQQTSRPIQIPSIARDLLEGTGLGIGMGLNGNGHANGRGGYGAY